MYDQGLEELKKMTIINERNIKMWSTIGTRATFGMATLDLAKSIKI